MATARHHARLAAPADEVWALVRDPASITGWLSGVDAVDLDGDERIVHTMGLEIREGCAVDDDLRRFQYWIVDAPIDTTFHLATIDVLAVEGIDGCVAVYSVDVEPADALPILDGVLAAGIAGLRERFG